jgi:hypothetical protein
MNGPKFTVGEEVLYQGRRYVIAGIGPGTYGFRLLAAASRQGDEAAIVHAAEADLETLESYLRARDDTYVT